MTQLLLAPLHAHSRFTGSRQLLERRIVSRLAVDLSVLRSIQIVPHEVLFLSLTSFLIVLLLLCELVVKSATLCLRNLVVRVGAANLISPLHLVGLDDQSSDLGLSIHSGQERHNKVGAFFSVWFK